MLEPGELVAGTCGGAAVVGADGDAGDPGATVGDPEVTAGEEPLLP